MNGISAKSPRDIQFWLQEADELKQVADQCWQVDMKVKHTLKKERVQGVAKALLQLHEGTESELNWLYNNLAAFAVYYLAIGILIQRNPQRFLDEAPKQRIVELIEECGIQLNSAQKTFLLRIENAFACLGQTPHRTLSLSPSELQMLKQNYSAHAAASSEQKAAMDELFAQLRIMAEKTETAAP